MAIRVLAFDPLKQSDVEQFEQDLDCYLSDGWDVLTTIAGNRPGVDGSKRSYRSARTMTPDYKDYVVFVLRNTEFSQRAMEKPEVIKRSQ